MYYSVQEINGERPKKIHHLIHIINETNCVLLDCDGNLIVEKMSNIKLSKLTFSS